MTLKNRTARRWDHVETATIALGVISTITAVVTALTDSPARAWLLPVCAAVLVICVLAALYAGMKSNTALYGDE